MSNERVNNITGCYLGFVLFFFLIGTIRQITCPFNIPVDPGSIGKLTFSFPASIFPPTGKSYVTKTVFLRCAQVIQTFTDDDVKRATA